MTNIEKKVTEILTEQGASVTTPETKIVESGIDSFGIVMILLELDEEFGCFGREYEDTTDMRTLRIQDLYDRITECS